MWRTPKFITLTCFVPTMYEFHIILKLDFIKKKKKEENEDGAVGC